MLARRLQPLLSLFFVSDHEFGFFCLDGLEGGLLLGNLVGVVESLLAGRFLIVVHFSQNLVHLLIAGLLAPFQRVVRVLLAGVTAINLCEVGEFILVSLLNIAKEVLELFKFVYFVGDELVLGLKRSKSHFSLPDSLVFFQDFNFFFSRTLLVFLAFLVLLAQERAETDKVVLNQNVLLSELLFTQTAPFLFFFKFFLLVFEGFLHLVHKAALLK